MPINYLCLDDEAEKVTNIAQLLSGKGDILAVNPTTPIAFDDEVRRITEMQPDGVLLDLRLDRTPDHSGQRVNYRALSLAQELRTRMTEKEIRPFPLILWSVDENYKLSFEKDDTGHDLFDIQYYKASITGDHVRISAELSDIAVAYKQITSLQAKTFKNLYAQLIKLVDDFDVIDPRIAGEGAMNRSLPAHIFAKSIMSNLVRLPGPLVSEKLLAVRLGVNLETSKDWNLLRDSIFANAKYEGIFGKAWPRWWMFQITKAWRQLVTDTPIASLSSEARVTLIKKATGIKRLDPIVSSEYGKDERFWHICKVSKRPIAPADGVLLSLARKEWQDGAYSSLHAILNREHRTVGFDVHPFEKPRLDAIRAKAKAGS